MPPQPHPTTTPPAPSAGVARIWLAAGALFGLLAVVAGAAGTHALRDALDFEVRGRDEAALLRLLERLPDAGAIRSDDYKVYEWLPHNKHLAGKYGTVNMNEGEALYAARQIKRTGEAHKGTRKERGSVGEPACAGICA